MGMGVFYQWGFGIRQPVRCRQKRFRGEGHQEEVAIADLQETTQAQQVDIKLPRREVPRWNIGVHARTWQTANR